MIRDVRPPLKQSLKTRSQVESDYAIKYFEQYSWGQGEKLSLLHMYKRLSRGEREGGK